MGGRVGPLMVRKPEEPMRELLTYFIKLWLALFVNIGPLHQLSAANDFSI